MARLSVSILRLLWWVACIPLEIIRAVWWCIVLVVRCMTQRNVGLAWAMVWLFYGYGYKMAYTKEGYDLMLAMLVVPIVTVNLRGLWLAIFRFPRAPWRLSARKPAPAPEPREIIATVAINTYAETKQSRVMMTARLSPSLQAFLARSEAQ